jgi:hypothetical protein
MVWKEEKNGCISWNFDFKLVLCCVMRSDKYHVADNSNSILKAYASHKARYLLWRLCRGCLPTQYRMLQRRVECMLNFSVCDEETDDNLHVSYKYSNEDQILDLSLDIKGFRHLATSYDCPMIISSSRYQAWRSYIYSKNYQCG